MHEQILADRERVLGPDHPLTLTSRNNLAIAYRDAGRAAEAIQMDEQTFDIRARVLGLDHPHTLTTRNSLAFAQGCRSSARALSRSTRPHSPTASASWDPTIPTP